MQTNKPLRAIFATAGMLTASLGSANAAEVHASANAPTQSAAVKSPNACPAMRWITLGTAGGPVPTIERAEPSNLLIAGGKHILVDTGDGTVNQLAKAGFLVGRVDTVFLSHHHHDHVGGLAAVIGLRWMNQFPGVLMVYGPPGTKEMVDGIIHSLGPQSRIGFGLGKPPPSPKESVQVVELDGKAPFKLADLTVTAVSNTHFDVDGKSGAGSAISLSYRFQLGNRSITYTGDTGPSVAVEQLAQGSDMLVTEVIDLERLLAQIKIMRRDATPETLSNMSKHLSTHHVLAPDIGTMAARANVGRVVLTHFAIPGPLAESEPDLRAGIRQSYAGPLDLARDLSSFDVGCK